MNTRLSGARFVAGATAIIGLLALGAGPVAADTTPPGDASYSQNGRSAELDAGSCIDNGDDTVSCSEQQITVFVGKMTDSLSGVTHASQLCVSVAEYTFSNLTGEYVGTPSYEQGCRVDLPTGSIRIDSKLASATLAETSVSIQDQACDKFECVPGPARDVLVAASWTGIGPLQTSKARGSGDDGTCRYSDWFKGSSREADVVGSVDGQAVTGDTFGVLSSGRYGYRSRCSEV